MEKLSGHPPFFIVGPGEAQDIPSLGYRVEIISTPEDGVEVLGKACTLLSVDSGLRHLAALVEMPRIVIYGPTAPGICGSGPGEIPIVSFASCAPCGDPFVCFGTPKHICLGEIDMGFLIREVESAWFSLHGGNRLERLS